MVAIRFLPVGAVRCGAQMWRTQGKLFATVVVKAAFGNSPDGIASMLPDCDPVRRRDEYYDNDGQKSLLDCSDLAPYLGRGEVFFQGAAYVPNGGRTVARLAVTRGGMPLVDKRLFVSTPSGASSSVVRVPIRYENAFGGAGHAANPVGRADAWLSHASNADAPASLGPIARNWSQRSALLRVEDRRHHHGKELRLNAGFPWEYFHAAPPDQRAPDFFQASDRVLLEGLTPGGGTITMGLPAPEAAARVLRPGKAPSSLALVADMLRIDGERRRITVTWRGFFPVDDERQKWVLAAGVSLPDADIEWPDAVTSAGSKLGHLPHVTVDPGAFDVDLGATEGVRVSKLAKKTMPFRLEPPATDEATEDAPPSRPGPTRKATPMPGAPWGTPAKPASRPPAGRAVTEAMQAFADLRPGASTRPPQTPTPQTRPPQTPPLQGRPPHVPTSPQQPPIRVVSPAPEARPECVELAPGLGSELLLAIVKRVKSS